MNENGIVVIEMSCKSFLLLPAVSMFNGCCQLDCLGKTFSFEGSCS